MTKIEVIHSSEEAGFQPPYLCKYKQDWDDIKDSGMKKKKKKPKRAKILTCPQIVLLFSSCKKKKIQIFQERKTF